MKTTAGSHQDVRFAEGVSRGCFRQSGHRPLWSAIKASP